MTGVFALIGSTGSNAYGHGIPPTTLRDSYSANGKPPDVPAAWWVAVFAHARLRRRQPQVSRPTRPRVARTSVDGSGTGLAAVARFTRFFDGCFLPNQC